MTPIGRRRFCTAFGAGIAGMLAAGCSSAGDDTASAPSATPGADGALDGYAIEGHVPAEAIRRLVAERPDAAGLAVPGMPSDAPGMGGDEASWADQPVVLVNRDGSLTSFSY